MKDNNSSFTFLKSLIPTLIVAASILVGLLSGAKIISNGVVEANRFQLGDWENGVFLFDSLSGGAYTFKTYSKDWFYQGGNTDNFWTE